MKISVNTLKILKMWLKMLKLGIKTADKEFVSQDGINRSFGEGF